MSEGFQVVFPLGGHLAAEKIHLPDEALKPAPEAAGPSADHVQAVDAVFTRQRSDDQLAAGLFGLWTSAMLLSDLTREHFHVPVDEAEPKPRLPDDDPAE